MPENGFKNAREDLLSGILQDQRQYFLPTHSVRFSIGRILVHYGALQGMQDNKTFQEYRLKIQRYRWLCDELTAVGFHVRHRDPLRSRV